MTSSSYRIEVSTASSEKMPLAQTHHGKSQREPSHGPYTVHTYCFSMLLQTADNHLQWKVCGGLQETLQLLCQVA